MSLFRTVSTLCSARECKILTARGLVLNMVPYEVRVRKKKEDGETSEEALAFGNHIASQG